MKRLFILLLTVQMLQAEEVCSQSSPEGKVNISISIPAIKSASSGVEDKSADRKFLYAQFKGVKGFCNSPNLSAQSLLRIKYDIESKFIDGNKDAIVRQTAKENCVTSSQISDMIKLITLDQVKYEAGLFVFQYVNDPSNYYLVSDQIGDISLKSKLDQFALDYLRSTEATGKEDASTSANMNVTVNSSSSTSQTTVPPNDQPVSSQASNTCSMNSMEYEDAIASVKSKPFAETKLTIARQAIKNRCITVEQLKGLLQLFSYENDKLEFAKYSYKSISDKEKFYTITKEFKFSSSADELNEFLESQN